MARRVFAWLLVTLCSTGLACTGKSEAVVATGTLSFAGKSIQYRINGRQKADVSAKSRAEQCTIHVNVDGKKHEVVVKKNVLEYQGAEIPLGDWKKMELIGDTERIRVMVDDKELSVKR